MTAAAAKRSIAIFFSIDSELRYQSGYFGEDGPPVMLKQEEHEEAHGKKDGLVDPLLANEAQRKKDNVSRHTSKRGEQGCVPNPSTRAAQIKAQTMFP